MKSFLLSFLEIILITVAVLLSAAWFWLVSGLAAQLTSGKPFHDAVAYILCTIVFWVLNMLSLSVVFEILDERIDNANNRN